MNIVIPPVLQAVGLACVPIADMPTASPLARKPVAAAVVTVTARGDGHLAAAIETMTDAREFEFPLPHLVDQALIASAPTVVTPADRAVLAADAVSRRFFAEPKLAALATGELAIDPTTMFSFHADEPALRRRLGIAMPSTSDRVIASAWDRKHYQVAENEAVGSAVSRLMLWAHAAAFEAASPDPFFLVLLPLRDRMAELEERYPALVEMQRSRAIYRATSLASYYREYRAQREAGDDSARWVTFEEGLTHF